MRNLTRSAIILALSFSCGHLSPALGQSSYSGAPQTGTSRNIGATISGRITVQGKAKAGIPVGLRGRGMTLGGAPSPKAVSDADGNYQITNIRAGNYQVIPLSPAYVFSDLTSFSGPGKTLVLAEGDHAEGIDFSLVRGAVITGRVTHVDGRPVIEESIYLLPAEQGNQRGPRSREASTQTDDRGVYRMFGLRAGQYKVSVGAPDDAFVSSRGRNSFQRVFYPGVTEFDEAKIVEIGEGSETKNIDITVGQSLKGFTVSGAIVDGGTNQPVSNVRLGLQKTVEGNYAPFIGNTSLSNARGEFRMENISPGKYSVFVLPQPNSDTLVDALQFEILDQDVAGLSLRTAKGASVSGFVVIEGTVDKRLYEQLGRMRLFAYVRGETPNVGSMGASKVTTIATDGSFRLGGLQQGSAMFNLATQDGSQPGFLISRIERDGIVQQRSGVEIKSTEQINGVRIVVLHGSGSIRGSVKFDDELPPTGARLMVSLTRSGDNLYSIRPEEIDARGRFVFQSLPAGSYDVILNSIVRTSGSGPLSRQTVTVSDGAATEVELVVNTGAKTNP